MGGCWHRMLSAAIVGGSRTALACSTPCGTTTAGITDYACVWLSINGYDTDCSAAGNDCIVTVNGYIASSTVVTGYDATAAVPGCGQRATCTETTAEVHLH